MVTSNCLWFYEGSITSYDKSENKHKVNCDDGHVKDMNLSVEQWEPIRHDDETDCQILEQVIVMDLGKFTRSFSVRVTVQLNYQGRNNVILFKVDWWDVYHKIGFKVDKFRFPMVNITRKLRTDEPYVLGSQAEQVYYLSDIKERNWQVVVKTKPCDFYDLLDDVVGDEPCQENENFDFTIQGSKLEDNNNVIQY
nr:transposon protein, putative, CACTA, En/Spm sub-class, expressed [Ipomoea batatas]